MSGTEQGRRAAKSAPYNAFAGAIAEGLTLMYASDSQMLVQGKVVTLRYLPFVAAVLLIASTSASAQELDGNFEGEKTWQDKSGNSHEIKPQPPRDGKSRQRLMTIVREGKWSADTEEEMVQGFMQWYVLSLTLKENLDNLPNLRKQLKTQLISAGKAPSPDLHTQLNDLTLKVCSGVALDARYPRAVRFNCMLMIGELDEREYNAGTGDKPAPLPAATSALIATVGDAKQWLALRVAAVIGLKRNLKDLKDGFPQALQGQASEALIGVLQTPVDEGRTLEGQVWLCTNAADVLTEMLHKKVPVDEAKYAAALVERIDDDVIPKWGRAKLAGDLGKLNGKSLPPPQVPVAVRSLAGLTLMISQTSPFAIDQAAEAEKAKQEETDKKAAEKKNADKKGTDKKAADKKSEDKKDDKPELAAKTAVAEPPSAAVQKLNSEEMMSQLSQIRGGLYGKEAPVGKDGKGPDPALGLYSAADDATKAMIDKIVGHIDEIVKSLAGVPDDKKETLDKLADTLRKTNDDLEDLLGAPEAEEAEAAQPAQPVAGRARPPAGNVPAGASTTGQ
jgi:hypothetical protein